LLFLSDIAHPITFREYKSSNIAKYNHPVRVAKKVTSPIQTLFSRETLKQRFKRLGAIHLVCFDIVVILNLLRRLLSMPFSLLSLATRCLPQQIPLALRAFQVFIAP
jgi:hypothetical protein